MVQVLNYRNAVTVCDMSKYSTFKIQIKIIECYIKCVCRKEKDMMIK